ncbi:MAG: tetratricopeptide repeat protein, partial [Candidatus Promineifilaceae bacterium]
MLWPPKTEQGATTRLGNRYQLFEPLGSGGMGTVYRAYDQLTGQTVALKRLPQTPMRPITADLRLALAHEFQALAALRHPGIITVRDYGFDEKQHPFFTMELLPFAQSFVAAGEMLSQDGRLNLLLQLLTTLTYIHRCDIVHRDLKPGNVLVTADGELKVLDFGLAGIPGEELPTSGTLPYMAPEILQGQPAGIGSDLYAVGIMAFELFAGWHPFAQTQNLPRAILYQSPDFSLVDISPDLEAVFQRLLAKDPANRYNDASATVTALCAAVDWPLPPETIAARESFLQAAPFIGRTRELYQLEAARREAVAGHGSGLLISGESGIGKSRLLQELRTRALVDGMLVLRGQAQENGGAYHLWLEAMRLLLLHTRPDVLEAAVLQAIVPDVARLIGRPIPVAPPLPPQAAQTRLYLTIADLLRQASVRRPLLLLLEDLHWADDNSLNLLQHLIPTLDKLAVCVVGSCRPGERPQLSQQLEAMQPLRLTALSVAQVADLSEAILGENGRQPTLLQFLERETEGNTFFIVEVVRALAEEAGRLDKITAVPLPASIFPSGIQQVVQRRLDRIPPAARPLLQTAAIAGRRLDLQLLAYLSPKTDIENWLILCANAGILEQPIGEPAWQFSHDKLREALIRQMPETEQPQWHNLIAEALETVYAAELAPHYGDLAHHFARAEAPEKERDYLRLAAQHAEETYANEAAIGYHRQLLSLLPDGAEKAAVYLSLGTLCKITGQWDTAQDYLQAAVAQSEEETTLQAQAYQLLGNLERSRQHFESAVTWFDQAQNCYEQLHDLSGICKVQVEMSNISYQLGEYDKTLEHLARAMTAAQTANDMVGLSLVQHNLASVAYSRGEYETAAAHNQEALTLRQSMNDLSSLAHSYNSLGLVAFRQGNWPAAQAYHEQSLALRRKIGDRWGTAASLSNLGMVPYQRRDHQTASRYWEEALQVRRQLGDSLGMAGLLDNLALVAVAQEALPKAKALIAEAVLIRRELNDRQGLAITLSNRGRLALLTNDLAEAIADYRVSLEIAQEIGDQLGVAFALAGIAAVWAAMERYTAAAGLLATADAHLEKIGGIWESDEKAIFDKAVQQAKSGLPDQAFTAAWENGRSMPPDQAIAFIIEETSRSNA